ncbi:MAG: DUF3164 family protein [Flavobacterium sp.]|nr:DUF3164 family protein [Flavobacterium sp.]
MSIDLTKLSAADLKRELARREEAKTENREAYKALVLETVPKVFDEIMYASNYMKDLKGRIFNYFKDVMELKAAAYEIKEKQASHTFTDEKYSITIGYRQTDGWDDTASAGIAKVNTFLQSLATNEDSAKLVESINFLLKKDAKDNLKANRVMELQKMTSKFNSPEFTDGVDIIVKSYKPVRSCWFVEASVLGKDGKWQTVPLSMSAVDFPAGFEFNFFSDTKLTEDGNSN